MLRDTNPTKYRELMEILGKKKKGAKLSNDMKEALSTELHKVERSTTLTASSGCLLLTQEEYIQHKIRKNGWNKKKAKKNWKKEVGEAGGIVSNGVTRLSVQKPPEVTEADAIKLSRSVQGKKGDLKPADLQKLSDVWGSGGSRGGMQRAIGKGAHGKLLDAAFRGGKPSRGR